MKRIDGWRYAVGTRTAHFYVRGRTGEIRLRLGRELRRAGLLAMRGGGWCIVVCGWASCSAPREAGWALRLEDAEPQVRARTIVALVDSRRADLAPLLADRLEDEDPTVRLCAAEALARLIGQPLAAAATSPYADRWELGARWRQYFREAARKHDEQSDHGD